MKSENSIWATLLVEYELTQNAAAWFDAIIWGSFVVCLSMASIVGYAIMSILVTHFVMILVPVGIMAAWYGFFLRHKKIQSLKFRRLHEIEAALGMKQHRMVHDYDKNGFKAFNSEALFIIILFSFPAVIMLMAAFSKIGK